jgi:hypothetical protein
MKPKPTTSRPPRQKLVRVPTANIPESLLERVNALLTYRGDFTKFLIDALTHEAERQEKQKASNE